MAPATSVNDRAHLLIVAHGERGGDGRDRFAHRLAAEAGRTDRFASARACFLSKQPKLAHVLQTLPDGPVVVYPLFMSDGYFVRQAIPRAIEAASAGQSNAAHTVSILEPFGLNPDLPGVVNGLAIGVAKDAGFGSKSCRLLLVAHGSRHDDASRRATVSIAQAIAQTGRFAGIDCGFLEEQPFLQTQVRDIIGPVIAAGLFAGEGMHGADDLTSAIAGAGRSDLFATPPLARSPHLFELARSDLSRQTAEYMS